MTREEAIKDIEENILPIVGGKSLRMAIDALRQPERKTGKWIYKDDLKQYFCSECGYPSLTYDDMYIYGMDLPNFCEDRGADMRTANEEGD